MLLNFVCAVSAERACSVKVADSAIQLIKTTLESERSTISFFILLAVSEEAVISKILRISLTVSFTENFSQPPKQFGL